MNLWLLIIGTNILTAGVFSYIGFEKAMKQVARLGLLPVLIASRDIGAIKGVELRVKVADWYRDKWVYLNRKYNPKSVLTWEKGE